MAIGTLLRSRIVLAPLFYDLFPKSGTGSNSNACKNNYQKNGSGVIRYLMAACESHESEKQLNCSNQQKDYNEDI